MICSYRTSVLVEPEIKIENFDTLKNVHLHITKDEHTCVEWLRKVKLVAAKKERCPRCEASGNPDRLNGYLTWYHSDALDRKHGYYLQCNECWKFCRARFSPFTNTFFDGKSCKLSVCDVIEIIWCWMHKICVSNCMAITGVSKTPVIDYYNFCREICTVALQKRSDSVIGESVSLWKLTKLNYLNASIIGVGFCPFKRDGRLAAYAVKQRPNL